MKQSNLLWIVCQAWTSLKYTQKSHANWFSSTHDTKDGLKETPKSIGNLFTYILIIDKTFEMFEVEWRLSHDSENIVEYLLFLFIFDSFFPVLSWKFCSISVDTGGVSKLYTKHTQVIMQKIN